MKLLKAVIYLLETSSCRMTVDFLKIFADEKLCLVCKQTKHAFRKETFQVNKELKEIIEN